MVVKALLRNAWWSVRGRALRRPALPAACTSLLFVCKGNICRSPFAAVLATSLLDSHGRHMTVASAGFDANPGKTCPPLAVEVASARGLRLTDHVPLPLTADLMGRFDLVVVMEVAHLTLLARSHPQFRDRLVLLPLFAKISGTQSRGYDVYNIRDPYGKSRAAFEACYEHLDRAVGGFVQALIATHPDVTRPAHRS